MVYKDIFISFNDGSLLDSNGGQLLQRPSIAYKAFPTWNINFVTVGADGFLSGVDLSEATAWHAAIDTDFNQDTQPIVRTLDSDIGKDYVTSGIVQVPLDAATCGFFEKVNSRDKIPAYFELRGLDSTDRPIYVYRIGIDCLGAIDAEGGEPLPVVSGGVTLNDVYAITRAQPEFRFGETPNGPWHSERTETDTYYQTRQENGLWSNSILIVNGQNGQPGQAATIEIGTVTVGQTASVTNVGTPTSAVFDFVIPEGGGGGGTTYLGGTGIDISNNTISVNTSQIAPLSSLTAHTGNSTIHVTSTEKTSWNAKLDASALNGYATTGYVDSAVAPKMTTPAGGTSGQFLMKNSTGYEWATVTGGGGGGTSYIAGTGIDITSNTISVDTTTIATADALDAHTGNSTIHVTSTDKTNWNAKLDSSALDGYATTTALTAHTSNSTIHVTSTDKTTWNAKLDSSALNGYATEQYVDDAISGVQPSPYKAVVEAYNGQCTLSPTGQFYLVGNGTSLTEGNIHFNANTGEFPSNGYSASTEGLIAYPASGSLTASSPCFIQSGFIPGYVNAFKATWVRGYGNTFFGCLIQPMGVINKFGLNIKWPNWDWNFPYINETQPDYDLEVTACSAYPNAVGGYTITGYDETSGKPIYEHVDGTYKIAYGMGMMQWLLYENNATTYLQTETMVDSPVTGPWYDMREPQTPGAMTVTLADEDEGGDSGGGDSGGGDSGAATSYTATSMESYFNGTYTLTSGTAGTTSAVYSQSEGQYYIAYSSGMWTFFNALSNNQTNSGPTGNTPEGTFAWMDGGMSMMSITVTAS